MPDLLKVAPQVSPEIERPAPDKLISGDPVFTTWNIEDKDGLYAGIWQSTVGKWRVSYDEWEYFRLLEGVSILTDSKGHETRLTAGDSYIIRPGFSGTWEVVETTRKDYVIRL
ncbi:cupin domain-containing protein [uncultured Lentibacter sp.]|uniref:cupin domain-containing protein n=1 Tax=uncultured Lentibacter sp. TaxID=1659309 RepID=UPI002606621C|nr:cupin domain-containing protein [uncultured Lentibacter sp.]